MGRNFDPTNVDESSGGFEAEIIAAEFVPGRPSGEQLKLSLEPKSYEGQVRYEWYSYKEKPTPKAIWAHFLKQLEKLKINLTSETDLVGYTMLFNFKEFDYGKIDKKEVVVKKLWPIKIINAPATDKDGKKVEFSEDSLLEAVMDEKIKNKNDAFDYFASERKSVVLKAIKKLAEDKTVTYDSKSGELKAA